MRVLVVGGGGREHALVWKLQFSPRVTAVYAAPGNAGISFLARMEPIPSDDVHGLLSFALQQNVDLTIVGPEAPLAAGIVDLFEGSGMRVFGPNRDAARIEASKVWAKELMQKHGIPTARFATASDPAQARTLADGFAPPVVVKADGLAGGKGVVVCQTREQVDSVIEDFMVQGIHGAAGRRLVIEEFLQGQELSVFAVADGRDVVLLTSARDYKPLLDADRGPNTGGMGGYTSPIYATTELLAEVERTILKPVVAAMAAEGTPYVGVLYAGLMLTESGPKVLEFNCRWGDPEAQLILPLLRTDLVDIADACIDHRIGSLSLDWDAGVACGVVLAAEGYPGEPARGAKIAGFEDLDEGVLAFHGATRLLTAPEPRRGLFRRGPRRTTEEDVGLVSDGGRVLTVVARGANLDEARARVYANVGRLSFAGMHYRRDVGLAAHRVDVALTASASDRTSALAPSLVFPGPEPTTSVVEPAGESPPPAVVFADGVTSIPQDLPSGREAARTERSSDARVAIVMGSESDRAVMEEAARILDALAVPHEVQVMSAHRTPERVRQFARGAEARGLKVIIAGAGAAAHLPGVIAAQTVLPVIGVPLEGSGLLGLDALLSIVQMPGGVPVATVALGRAGACNAAYLAAAILGLSDDAIGQRYRRFRVEQSSGELA